MSGCSGIHRLNHRTPSQLRACRRRLGRRETGGRGLRGVSVPDDKTLFRQGLTEPGIAAISLLTVETDTRLTREDVPNGHGSC